MRRGVDAVSEARVGIDACGYKQVVHGNAAQELDLSERVQFAVADEVAPDGAALRFAQVDFGNTSQQKALLAFDQDEFADLSTSVAATCEMGTTRLAGLAEIDSDRSGGDRGRHTQEELRAQESFGKCLINVQLAHGSLVTPLMAFTRVSAGVSDFRSGTIWAKSPNGALMNQTSSPRLLSSKNCFQYRLPFVVFVFGSRSAPIRRRGGFEWPAGNNGS